MNEYMKIGLLYLLLASLVTAIFTIYDKLAAKSNPRHRVSEAGLLLMGLAGGAVVEFVVMQLIRHKTRHMKFMLGLPLIILLQAAGLFAAHFFIFCA